MHKSTATSEAVNKACCERFAQFVLPEIVATCFTSSEFEDFLEKNHITMAPYHLAFNGLAKRVVQIVKVGKGIKKKHSIPGEVTTD